MFEKLDNETWERYIHDYENRHDNISISNYCREKGLNKSNFFYHRRRLKDNIEPVLQSVTVKRSEEITASIKKQNSNVAITFENASITIPSCETDLILSIVKEMILSAKY